MRRKVFIRSRETLRLLTSSLTHLRSLTHLGSTSILTLNWIRTQKRWVPRFIQQGCHHLGKQVNTNVPLQLVDLCSSSSRFTRHLLPLTEIQTQLSRLWVQKANFLTKRKRSTLGVEQLEEICNRYQLPQPSHPGWCQDLSEKLVFLKKENGEWEALKVITHLHVSLLVNIHLRDSLLLVNGNHPSYLAKGSALNLIKGISHNRSTQGERKSKEN